MENEKSDEARREDCCGGGSDQANGPGAGCACGAAPPRRPWLRTLIAAVVILAAVGVGAYSLVGKREAEVRRPAGRGSGQHRVPAQMREPMKEGSWRSGFNRHSRRTASAS
ncbi:MAG: hypothetical protein NTW97_01540 [Candidatus Krumholzibacteria bacterium]|nr:hypothetical protein [Candidatus Krumholzibacteria bacterium]